MKGIIIFTDVRSSALLFTKYSNRFVKKIYFLNKVTKYYVKKYQGLLVKQIGDSSMVYFEKNNILGALCFIISLQKYLNEKNFSIADDNIYIRIGCSYGDMNKKREKIQGCNVIDFYGNNVNTASRLESKVSKPGGFSIYNIDIPKYIKKLPKNLKKYLDKNFFMRNKKKYDIKTFKKNKNNNNNNKIRSSKLINSITELKGAVIKNNLLFTFNPKKKIDDKIII